MKQNKRNIIILSVILFVALALCLMIFFILTDLANKRESLQTQIFRNLSITEAIYLPNTQISPGIQGTELQILSGSSVFYVNTNEGYKFLINVAEGEYYFICRYGAQNCNATGYIDINKKELGGAIYLDTSNKQLDFRIMDLDIKITTESEMREIINNYFDN